MIFDLFPVGPFQCNCVILGCEETKAAVVIDPGEDADRILQQLAKWELKTLYLFHTHAHIDHIGATDAVRTQTRAETALHEEDMFLCQNVALQASLFDLSCPPVPTIDLFLRDGDIFSFGKHRVEVLHTPGHTPGSVSLHIPTMDFSDGLSGALFTGDTLFKGSIGRTDLWRGSYPTLIDSIKTKLLSFPDTTAVYPGHGPATTIGAEKEGNPFVGSELF
jgi:glyoxylase-like metal-dependent hydrolase (beta-lactamase superfamily II)